MAAAQDCGKNSSGKTPFPLCHHEDEIVIGSNPSLEKRSKVNHQDKSQCLKLSRVAKLLSKAAVSLWNITIPMQRH